MKIGRKIAIVALALIGTIIVSGCIIREGFIEKETIEEKPSTIKIAAFNIQIFGRSKRQKDHVMNILTKIAREFDIVLVQRRMILMNATYSHEYVDDSARVFYFDKEYGLDDETLVWEVSDHYPIYAEFKTDLMDDD